METVQTVGQESRNTYFMMRKRQKIRMDIKKKVVDAL